MIFVADWWFEVFCFLPYYWQFLGLLGLADGV